MHAGLRERENAPADLHDSQPQTRTYALNDERAGNLHHCIRDRVDTACVRVFVAVHAEFFLHAGHVSISHVALVEILHEEAKTADAKDSDIKFEEQTLFLGSLEVCVGVPDEGAERSFLFGGWDDISSIVGWIDLDVMAVDLLSGQVSVRIAGRHLFALVMRLLLDDSGWRRCDGAY